MNLTPEQIQAILSAGDPNDPVNDEIAMGRAQVQQLRQRAAQGGGPTQMAGRLVLPNWANAAGAVASGYQASKLEPQVQSQAKAQHQRSVDARQQYLKAMMEALRQQVPGMATQPQATQQQPEMPGMGMPGAY